MLCCFGRGMRLCFGGDRLFGLGGGSCVADEGSYVCGEVVKLCDAGML
jgi:hypothetical protein